MLISYNWLKEYLKDPLPEPNELARILTMHSFEVEDVNKKNDDFILDIDVLPNRGHDCLSHFGIAKEVSVLTGNPIIKPEGEVEGDESTSSQENINLSVDNPKLVRRAMKRYVSNVKVGESPDWLKEKLVSIGQKPINNIVDITNFVMFETGQPVHAFDFDKIAGDGVKKISIRDAKKGEKIKTLDEGEYELTEEMLVIADDEKPLDIAGVKGGFESGIDKNTKKLVLSVCNFHPTSIRKTSRELGLLTDASKRFEQEITPELAEEAMERMSYLLEEFADGVIAKDVVDFYPNKRNPYKVGFTIEEANKLLGTNLKNKDAEEILNRLEFEWEKVLPKEFILNGVRDFEGRPYMFGSSISYNCPQYFDCGSLVAYLHAHAGIAMPRLVQDQFTYGEKISEKEIKPGDLVYSSTNADGKVEDVKTLGGKYKRKTKQSIEFLPGKIFEKSVDHAGMYLGDGKVIHASPMWDKGKVIVEDLKEAPAFKEIVGFIRIPAAEEEHYVVTPPKERLDLMSARSFLASGTSADIIEEIGRVYGYENIKEEIPSRDWNAKPDKEFYYTNKIKDTLVGEGFSEVQTYAFQGEGEVEVQNPLANDKKFLRSSLAKGLQDSLRLNKKTKDLLESDDIKIFEIGRVFDNEDERLELGIMSDGDTKEVIKTIEREFGKGLDKSLVSRVGVGVIINLSGYLKELPEPKSYDDLADIDTSEVKYEPVSQYPYVLRDVAFWVSGEESINELEEMIRETAGNLLKKVKLFDEYKKDDKTSYAFNLVFQSSDKTLTDAEVNEIMDHVYKTLEDKGYEIR